MPSNARDLDGNIVRVATYRRERHEGKIVCPDCKWRMRYQERIPGKRIDYFAHMPRKAGEAARKCAWALMSPQHHNALRTLAEEAPQVFDALAGVLGKEEARLQDNSRRADVLFAGDEATGRYPVAFEAQFSRITYGANGTGRTIQERTRDYHANGVHVVWCFFDSDKQSWARDLIKTCRRVYGCVGILDEHGLSVSFDGVKALWLDSHPIDALDRRTAYRAKKEEERVAEAIRLYDEEQERRAEVARREAEQRARMEEARQRIQNEQWWKEFDARQRAEAVRLQMEYEQRQAEYERQAEARRRAEIEAVARAEAERTARITETNRRLGIDPARDAFTVEPVDVPASALLGTPRRVLYRVFYRGAPVGWISEAKVTAELTRLNEMTANRKRGAA